VTALPHDLCACDRCADAARLILRDVYGKRCTMTEPERRRAAGETPFCSCNGCTLSAGHDLRQALHDGDLHSGSAKRCAGALLRALVLQQLLVTFSPPWTEVAS